MMLSLQHGPANGGGGKATGEPWKGAGKGAGGKGAGKGAAAKEGHGENDKVHKCVRGVYIHMIMIVIFIIIMI